MVPWAVALLPLLAVVTAAPPTPDAESTLDSATRELLAALEDRRMPDVALWVLDRVDADPAAGAALKRESPYRRAVALLALSRIEADPERRSRLVTDAERQFDGFLAGAPAGALAVAAWSQKGNLLVERGRAALEAAGRPGADERKLREDAIRDFDAALTALQGTIGPDQAAAGPATNAEDAAVLALRAVNARIDQLGGDGGGSQDANRKPARPTSSQQQLLRRLEADREALQARLLQVRLDVARAHSEKSRGYPEGSDAWKAALGQSSQRYKALADKYPARTAGVLARVMEGRTYALLGDRDRAVAALAPVAALQASSPLASQLRAKALATMLECWLADGMTDRFDEDLRAFVLTPADRLPGRTLDADWLTVKYRAACMLDLMANAARDPATPRALRRDAKRLATDVAMAGGVFAREARELAADLGKELPSEEADRSFAALWADARLALAALHQHRDDARRLEAAGRTDEAAVAAARAAGERETALARHQAAIAAAEADPQPSDEPELNAARATLAGLLFEAGRYREAAELGGLLVERFPNAVGSRQVARVALSARQQLTLSTAQPAPTAADKEEFRRLADLVARTWPNDPEGADAFALLVGFASEARDPAAIIALLDAVPSGSPRRGELAARAGTALAREAQLARTGSAGVDAAALASWKSAARAALDRGLADLGDPQSSPATVRVAVAAALARAQLAIDEGDEARAETLLENPVYGPWTKAIGDDPAFSRGPLAESALTVALRHFIQTEQLEKAQAAMKALERAAGTGAEASARLAALYLAMARDLQAQLAAVGDGPGDTAEARQRGGRIRAGFEKFLDGVAARDPKPASQLWVASTYLSLGSGEASGTVVSPADAARQLDRAAELFERLVARLDDPATGVEERAEIARLEPSIRLRIAGIHRRRGRWDAGRQELDRVLADPRGRNSIDAQMQAAELFAAAGRAADDDAARDLLQVAAFGRAGGDALVWGWNGISKRLAATMGPATDASAAKARERFFEARLRLAETLVDAARLPDRDGSRSQRLSEAKTVIATTRKLYPDLGGTAAAARFEALLKEIQRDSGTADPGGFAQLDEEAAAR